MEEMKTSVPGTEGVEGTDGVNYVWSEKISGSKDNYRSVSIRGEVYALGDCVRCFLESKESCIGKIIKLLQVGDRKRCRIRRFFSHYAFPPTVKGLDSAPEPKELFLASGEGPGVQEDISLEAIVGRIIIFCTAEDDYNGMPSGEQIENAENFFHRGYDPTSEEVVGLDGVVEELGAQKVYNKKEWLVDKVAGRSSSQISASRIHTQSPASGSSSHQGAAKGTYSSVPEVSPAPSRDSTERKLKKRKSDNLAPEQHKVDAVEKKNELHTPKKPKVEKSTISTEKSNVRSDHVVFAIPAPAKGNPIQGQGVSPGNGKPRTSSTSKSKSIQREGKGEFLKSSSSPTALVGSKQAETKGGGGSAERKRKDGEMPSEGTLPKILKPGERSIAPPGRENPSKLHLRADEGIVMATSLGSKQAVTKDGGVSVERQRKNGEIPSEETLKRVFKPGERSNALSGNPSKLQKRADEGIDMATSHATRKVPSAPTSLTKKVPNLTVKVPTVNPRLVMKTVTSVPSASPRASKELVKTDVGSRVLKRDEDVAHAPSTTQRQSGSQALNMSARKGSTATGKDPRLPRLSPRESPRATLSKSLSERDIDVMNLSEPSPTASPQQKPHGQIFKPKVEDWDATIALAIQHHRVLLLKNVDSELHSDDLAESLSEAMKIKCEVRIAPPVSFSYRTTTALLKLPSHKKAQEVLEAMESEYILVANRPVTATFFSYADFKGPQILKFPGHLEFSQGRDHAVEDYKNALATSHLAQGNTIEFAYGLPWRVLDEQHEEQWRLLQEAHHIMMNVKAGPH